MVPELVSVIRKCLQREDEFVENAWTLLYDIIGNLVDKFKEEDSKH